MTNGLSENIKGLLSAACHIPEQTIHTCLLTVPLGMIEPASKSWKHPGLNSRAVGLL